MLAKDLITKRILESAKNSIKSIEENNDPNYTLREKDLKTNNEIIENIDEISSITSARDIKDILQAYSRRELRPHMISKKLQITEGSEEYQAIVATFNKTEPLNYRHKGPLLDQKVQEIYEKLGYEGTLPTHEEIFKLEEELKNASSKGLSEEEQIKIQKAIDLKKCALGENTTMREYKNAMYAPSERPAIKKDIDEYYDRKLKELQLSKMTKQETVPEDTTQRTI